MKVAAVKSPGGFGNLIIEERADPVPGHGEILVRIHASSLNYHDLAVIKGMIKTCLLYTSPSPRDGLLSRMPSSA